MKSVSTLLLTLTFTSLVVAQAAVFAPINGVYNGLFFETNGYWQQSSGSINITTTSRGRYTARPQIGPKRYSFSGQFDADGRVDRQVLRYYDNPLTVRFQVDSDDPDFPIWANRQLAIDNVRNCGREVRHLIVDQVDDGSSPFSSAMRQ